MTRDRVMLLCRSSLVALELPISQLASVPSPAGEVGREIKDGAKVAYSAQQLYTVDHPYTMH